MVISSSISASSLAEPERIASRHRAFAATSADHYPRAAAAAATLAGFISTQQYVWGLHRVLDGITTSTTADPGVHE